MSKIEIDLVNTSTQDENHQSEDIKPGVLYDGNIGLNEPKAMKSEKENEHVDVEGDVVKTELKVERGNDSESETFECKRNSAEHEVLNFSKTAKSVEIKSENEENEKEENQIRFSAKKFKGDEANNEDHVSDIMRKKSFKQKRSAKRGGKSFQCDICSKMFKRNALLENHHRTHTCEKPFECQTCRKTFSFSQALKHHERIHTGEKPFECTTCNRKFSYSHHLKRHEKLHIGEKPFECKMCQKSFLQSVDLKKHERIHTNEKPYKCKICKKTFSVEFIQVKNHLNA